MNAPASYPPASLETAACLWEAVLEMEGSGITGTAAAIAAARGRIGTSGLRLVVIGWTHLVDEAWKAADTDNGKNPHGGEYPNPFDWDFVPGWLHQNVDWSTDYPSLKQR